MSSADNLYARDGFWWWVGVVEDRMDPLKLGRCRVRILGYHIENKRQLPTQDLPWAMPMTPIFSAAISGKGDAPLGPLEGTWVIGFFADGKECQTPIMMGTMGGMPGSSNACIAQSQAVSNTVNAQRDSNGNIIYDEKGVAIPVEPAAVDPNSSASRAIFGTLPPLEQTDIQALMDAIALKESSSVAGGAQNYHITNTIGYAGKYQFGAGALTTLGYLKPNLSTRPRQNSDMEDSQIWSGKSDCNSLQDFLANKNNVQEVAMFELLRFNYNELKRLNVIDAGTSTKEQVAGYLAAAHLKGAGGAKQLSTGNDNVDGNGTAASSYYAMGAQAVGGTGTKPVAAASRSSVFASAANAISKTITGFAGALNNPKLGTPDGYSDPNSVYPKCDYTGRADTNKLATNNDKLDDTPKPVKDENRVQNVDTANGAASWEEPPSAYAAKYPYNKVKETESGHVIELDDTPNAERIHIYHKTGTYVEIDREGSVSYKVMGENYNIYTRNNRVYTQGNMDVTVDGAKSLLVKNTLDVEVIGKTTVNLKDDCDINVSKDLRIKAQNIYMEAQQDINFVAGNYESHRVGGDLSYTVVGDEQHRVYGSFDADAMDINLNSGTSNPFGSLSDLGSGLDNGILGLVSSQGFDATGLFPLPVDIGNPLNSVGKGLSGILGGFGTGGLGLLGNALSNPAIANAVQGFSMAGVGLGALSQTLGKFGGGGVGGILSAGGIDGLNSVLKATGISESVSTLIANATSNPAIANAINSFGNIDEIISSGGLGQLNQQLGELGLGNLDKIISDAGLDLNSLVGIKDSLAQTGIMDAIKSAGLIPEQDLLAGENLIKNFYKYGVANIDVALPQVIGGLECDASEFASWTDFPAVAQLSKYFNLGDLSSRVQDVASQFSIMPQADLTQYDIITNLKHVAVNVLDPIMEQYPNLQISNGFKPVASYLMNIDDNNPYVDLVNAIKENVSESAADTVLQSLSTATPFEKGQGVNLHFKGATASDYFEIAKWIKNNVAYDQLRLEYSTIGNAEPWIGVTYNKDYTRNADAFDKVVTSVNGVVVANYLADMSS